MQLKIEKFENGDIKSLEVDGSEPFVSNLLNTMFTQPIKQCYDSFEEKELDVFNLDNKSDLSVRFPNIINKLRCPECGQASVFTLKADTENLDIINTDDGFNMLEDVSLIPPLNKVKNKKQMIKELEDYATSDIVLTNSDDICSCTMCNYEGTIKEFNNCANVITDRCKYCGEEIDEWIDSNLKRHMDCKICNQPLEN